MPKYNIYNAQTPQWLVSDDDVDDDDENAFCVRLKSYARSKSAPELGGEFESVLCCVYQ